MSCLGLGAQATPIKKTKFPWTNDFWNTNHSHRKNDSVICSPIQSFPAFQLNSLFLWSSPSGCMCLKILELLRLCCYRREVFHYSEYSFPLYWYVYLFVFNPNELILNRPALMQSHNLCVCKEAPTTVDADPLGKGMDSFLLECKSLMDNHCSCNFKISILMKYSKYCFQRKFYCSAWGSGSAWRQGGVS